jgi:PAS domain S-box-containing protein
VTEHPNEGHPGRDPHFRSMAERGPILVRTMGAESRCRWANRAWLEFTGASLEHLLDEGWLQHVHPEDRDRCARTCREGFQASRIYPLEFRLRRKNGQYSWVLEIATPHLDSDGNVGGYVGTAIEITEQKQARTHLALQYTVARILSEAATLEEAGAPILQSLCESLGWDLGQLWTVDGADRPPRCVQLWASPAVDLAQFQRDSRSRAFPQLPSSPWQNGEPVWIADIAADEVLALEPEARQLGLHGMFRLPVSMHGEVRALLRVFSRGARVLDPPSAELMTAVGLQIGQFLERQLSLDRIQESEARKAAILEASLDALVTIDNEGRVVEFNSAAESIFGYCREDVVGRELVSLIVPPRSRAQAVDAFQRYRKTGDSGLLGRRFDSGAMRSDGSEFPVEVAMAPIGTGDQRMLTLFVRDTTARKKAEYEVIRYQDRLRTLMADLMLAEEHERRRLAVDLHDGLSQTIALTQLKLSALHRTVDGNLAKSLDEIKELIGQVNKTARSMSFELSPPTLHDLGLQAALQWLVENIQARYGIEIVLEDDGEPKAADEKTRVILFRSIRELLINAAKHAEAQHVRVCLECEDDDLVAAIVDDGVGMEPDLASIHGSGLFSIQERLNHVGGSMRIESAPGRGTKILLRAPLTSRRQVKGKVKA